ncbi:hypothetical protein DY000_02051240 [Brassica cretica]|uniref:RING-type domain-containing protein n=1 Tax=Brassica cretica TaxID=69181 RepID=A0ABQ7F1Q2_BRACR|nr:hypothetical protein DY000_02051240 [Brassica cretica]
MSSSKAKRHKSGGSQRGGPLLVDVESGGTTRLSKNRTKRQSDQANVDLNNPRKSKTVAPPVEEPKFNCPICMCPFTEEVSTKCGHIFCKKCIKLAVSVQAKCPTVSNGLTLSAPTLEKTDVGTVKNMFVHELSFCNVNTVLLSERNV